MAALTVADVMHREVPVVRENTPYKQIAAALSAYRVSAVPVVDSTGRLTGIVSESDLVERPASHRRPNRLRSRWWPRKRARKVGARTAAGLMTHPAVAVTPRTALADAARVAADAGVHQLPVVYANAIVGMVNRADLLADYLRPDDAIHDEVVNRLIVREFCLDPACIHVAVEDGVVYLTGCVEHRPIDAFLEFAVRAVPGVVDVDNRLSWRHEVRS
jgi:CBS domain-containing protein